MTASEGTTGEELLSAERIAAVASALPEWGLTELDIALAGAIDDLFREMFDGENS